jgi:hypothetical protein
MLEELNKKLGDAIALVECDMAKAVSSMDSSGVESYRDFEAFIVRSMYADFCYSMKKDGYDFTGTGFVKPIKIGGQLYIKGAADTPYSTQANQAFQYADLRAVDGISGPSNPKMSSPSYGGRSINILERIDLDFEGDLKKALLKAKKQITKVIIKAVSAYGKTKIDNISW